MRYSVLLVLPLVAACGVGPENYQKGDNATRPADMNSCMAQATREVPQRLDYANIDLNSEARLQNFNDCMINKGYEIA